MKRFIIKILLFILAFIIISYMLQIIIDTGLKRAKVNKYYDWNLAIKGEMSSDIIILGSSRAWVHYNPKIIEKYTNKSCYNLGIDAANMQIQQTKWNIYKTYNKKPKIIIQNVDLGTLQENENIGYKDQYLPYLSYDEIYKPLSKIDNELWIDKWMPLYKYHGYVSNAMLGVCSFFYMCKPKYSKYKGFEGHNLSWVDNNNFKRNKKNSSLQIYDNGLNLLNALVSECKKDSIMLILSWSPQYYELIQIQEPERSIIKEKIVRISNENAHVEFWDYSQDSLNYSKEYFYNSLHLNTKGAMIFSEKFAKKLNEYILTK